MTWPLPLIVVDLRSKLPHGRPCLTAVVSARRLAYIARSCGLLAFACRPDGGRCS